MKVKYFYFYDIIDAIENEGFDYFINGYSHPDSISIDADNNCLNFKQLWEQVLPLLEEMQTLIKKNQESGIK